MPQHQPSTGSSVLHALRISLHIMFAILLGAGVAIALRDQNLSTFSKVGAVHGALTLGVLYVAGTALESRYAKALQAGRRPKRNPRTLAPLWLMLITVLWAVLMAMSAGFTWLVFPLMFLVLYLLPVVPALTCVVLLTAYSILFPLYRPGTALLENLNPGMIIGPVLGAIIATIISFAYRALHEDALTQARIAEQLRAAQAELAQQEHEAGRLEERERLAREIHDTLAQGLSSIVLMSRAGQNRLAQGRADQAEESLALIEKSASENLAEARRFIKDLSSPALTDHLIPALTRLCVETQAQETAKGTPLRCIFRLDGVAGENTDTNHLPEELTQALLRIAQGTLANVTAHARAETAAITLGVWENLVTLDIFDDGRGFSPLTQRDSAEEQHHKEHTYGLTSLTARAQALKGSLTIDSAPGAGTVISAHFPLSTAHPVK